MIERITDPDGTEWDVDNDVLDPNGEPLVIPVEEE